MKIKPVMFCAHSDYEASFEACFMDLGCLEKQFFNSAVGKQQKASRHIAVNSLCHSGPFPDWLSSPIAVLNGFKVVIFAATTKLVVTTSN